MKKVLLVLTLGLFALASSAQEVFFVFPPAITSGSYDMTWADDWGATPDFTDPANNVTGVLALAYDGQELDANSENDAWDACEDIINPEDVNGKIAVLYRGLCEFGAKALRAQDAGAIAVVIINRDNEVIPMGGGADGFNITIPVVMITSVDGAAIVDEMATTDVSIMIGTNNGLFQNNVGVLKGDFLHTKFGAHKLGAASLSDPFDIGTTVRNFGTDSANVSVMAEFSMGGTVLYSETSDVFNIPAGDTLIYMLPQYTDPITEEGVYSLDYTIITTVEDEFVFDNEASVILNVNDSRLAYCRMTAEGEPQIASGTRPADHGDGDDYSQCVVFKESNGSMFQAEGVRFATSIDTPDELTGQLISATLYEWNDEFVDMNDVNFLWDELNGVAFGQFEYVDNAADVYQEVSFDEIIELQDDVRYLFCVTSTAGGIRMGYDQGMDYTFNTNNYLQPTTVVDINGDWSIGFTGGGVQTVVAVIGDNSVSVEENEVATEEIAAFPNPAINEINIPVSKVNEIVSIDVYDTSGKLVLTNITKQKYSSMLNMDVSTLEGGLYSFKATYENGTETTFNVVITK